MQSGPMIIGHRGIPVLAPENTLAGIEKALELGADGIEIDVHLSQDGHVVVCHDERVDRTSDGKGAIAELTLAQLKEMDFGSWFDSSFTGERIPLLSEVLELFRGNAAWLNIELKTNVTPYPGIVQKTVELLREYDMMERTCISSFNHYTLVETQEVAPELPTALLYSACLYQPWQYAVGMKAKGLHPAYYTVDEATVSATKESGLFINPWTVDRTEDMERLARYQVTGIITNRPGLLRQVLGR